MSDSPRHNVGSIADPHWVVDEEHYLKAVADSDHFFACWQDTLEQRDKAIAILKLMREEYQKLPHSLGYSFSHLPKIDVFLEECGK